MEKVDKINHSLIFCMVSRLSLVSIEELQGHCCSQHKTIRKIFAHLSFVSKFLRWNTQLLQKKKSLKIRGLRIRREDLWIPFLYVIQKRHSWFMYCNFQSIPNSSMTFIQLDAPYCGAWPQYGTFHSYLTTHLKVPCIKMI